MFFSFFSKWSRWYFMMILLLRIHSFSFAAQRLHHDWKVSEWIVNNLQQVCTFSLIFFVLQGNLRNRYPADIHSASFSHIEATWLDVVNFMISLLKNNIESCLWCPIACLMNALELICPTFFLDMSNSNILWLGYPGSQRRSIWALSLQKHQWLPFSSQRSQRQSGPCDAIFSEVQSCSGYPLVN